MLCSHALNRVVSLMQRRATLHQLVLAIHDATEELRDLPYGIADAPEVLVRHMEARGLTIRARDDLADLDWLMLLIIAVEHEAARRHNPSDHDCKGGVVGDRFPI